VRVSFYLQNIAVEAAHALPQRFLEESAHGISPLRGILKEKGPLEDKEQNLCVSFVSFVVIKVCWFFPPCPLASLCLTDFHARLNSRNLFPSGKCVPFGSEQAVRYTFTYSAVG